MNIMKLFFVLLFLVSSNAALGQSPMSIELKTAYKTCSDNRLRLDVKIVNISDEPIAIDKSAIWYMFSFSYKADSKTIVNDLAESKNENFVILYPKKGFRASRLTNLTQSFFEREGIYHVAVTYGRFREAFYDNVEVWAGTVKSNFSGFMAESCPN